MQMDGETEYLLTKISKFAQFSARSKVRLDIMMK